MPTTISDFLSNYQKDVARQSRFDVNIPVPWQLMVNLDTARQLSLHCESTEMPGRTFVTTDKKIGSVPLQKYAYQSTYNDLQMTFIVSGDMSEKIFFDSWMELINPTSNFNFTYKNTYVTDITISQYDMQNNLTYKAELIDAYPISVNQLDLDWSSENYHKLTVVFAYTYWNNVTVSNIGDTLAVEASSGLNNLLSGLTNKI